MVFKSQPLALSIMDSFAKLYSPSGIAPFRDPIRTIAQGRFFIPLQTRLGFSEVTGGRTLSFRKVSVGEIPAEAGRRAKFPRRYVAEKTSPGALELKKSRYSLIKYGLCKDL